MFTLFCYTPFKQDTTIFDAVLSRFSMMVFRAHPPHTLSIFLRISIYLLLGPFLILSLASYTLQCRDVFAQFNRLGNKRATGWQTVRTPSGQPAVAFQSRQSSSSTKQVGLSSDTSTWLSGRIPGTNWCGKGNAYDTSAGTCEFSQFNSTDYDAFPVGVFPATKSTNSQWNGTTPQFPEKEVTVHNCQGK